MATSRTSRKSTTYAEALRDMRSTASRNVEEAINASKPQYLPKPPKGARRHAGAREAHCFFDGVVEALAVAVCDAAIPGKEVEMALLIAESLVSKVNAASCVGRC